MRYIILLIAFVLLTLIEVGFVRLFFNTHVFFALGLLVPLAFNKRYWGTSLVCAVFYGFVLAVAFNPDINFYPLAGVMVVLIATLVVNAVGKSLPVAALYTYVSAGVFMFLAVGFGEAGLIRAEYLLPTLLAVVCFRVLRGI